MRRTLLAAVACLTALLGAGARAAEDAEERLIVLGGDLTEIVFALGAGDRVVGVDSTSTYPQAATELPEVGYVRQLAPEGLLSLAPTGIIAAHDAGPESALDKVRAAGVPVFSGPADENERGVLAKIAFIGEALGLEAEAGRLAGETAVAFAEARPSEPSGVRAILVMAGRGGSMVAAGEKTSADAILKLAGAENALTGFEGFKPVSAEALVAAAPEVIVAPDHVLDGLGGVEGLLKRPEIAVTPAGMEGRVVVMDTMLLLGFGPRTPQAVRELAAALADAK